ncbi:GNAT family N-acetyltransferase [Halobium salinum]|uniref:GNAT family N-acetyltransferase n=1 Tax=Halobium salinum TaxID=1364940 RepID=A0ABD5P7B3_9EURY|nr:GNAT family protein [Halobium salinum]
MPGPIVERGDRLSLRTAEKEDARFLQRGSTDPDIRYLLGTVSPNTEHETEEHITDGDDDNVQFLVCLEDDDAPVGHPDEDDDVEPIGAVMARHIRWDRASLAWWLVPEHHGQGYGKEAATLFLDHLFRTYDLHSLGADAYDFNEASQGLIETLGFEREGRGREVRFVDGEYRDAVKYGLLRREWEARE